MTRAVVFAYHNVGLRCLATLLAHGVEVPLVVTQRDSPGENIWFASVAGYAAERELETAFPEDPNEPAFAARVEALAPDFLFSFYYRRMLGARLLAAARRGALNMHGSLLPKYRGRAPVNWAVIRGESETGASLHYMTAKPDAGALVAQQRVPILPDDTAREVFDKVTVAAELALDRALPELLAGRGAGVAQDLAAGSYYGARRPEDGRIDWSRGAREIHDLVRGVAPPYPGAFASIGGVPLRILRTRVEPGHRVAATPALYCEGARCYVDCASGGRLRLLEFELDGRAAGAAQVKARFGPQPAIFDRQATIP
ncbi:MAG TPA: formyltransferase [Burkholderiales bacterium]|nr:formyltransferase [Burkholderiales bacterium]